MKYTMMVKNIALAIVRTGFKSQTLAHYLTSLYLITLIHKIGKIVIILSSMSCCVD